MQRVSDASGRTKAVASLSGKEKGTSRAPSSVGESRGNAGSSIRKDEEGGNTETTIRKDEGVDPKTAPLPISDDDNNVKPARIVRFLRTVRKEQGTILLQKRAERLRAEEELAEAELEEVEAELPSGSLSPSQGVHRAVPIRHCCIQCSEASRIAAGWRTDSASNLRYVGGRYR